MARWTPQMRLERLLPTPKSCEIHEGLLTIPFTVKTEETAWHTYAETLSASVEKLFGHKVTEGAGILLRRDGSLPQSGYHLDSTGEGVVLTAATDEGICYAMATALQMMELTAAGLTLGRAVITDAPDRDYRTLMVDLAREWHSFDTILHYVDVCFMLKLRYLHLHFIDSQRYTLPSASFPRLNADGEHYSSEQIRVLRAYAKARGVILVPEFETPGHAAMLVKQYPEVFANEMDGEGGTMVTETGETITAANIVCAGSEKSMEATKILLAEIAEMFPESPYIHIGGDEANIKAWRGCRVCRDYMQRHGIKDEKELYSEFVGRAAKAVFDLGRTPIVWEGFPREGVQYIPKETIVIAWESKYHMAYDLLNAGFRIINGSWQPLYIVPSLRRRWNYSDIMGWNIFNWQHFWEHSEAKLNPITVPATDRVLGAQISAWECTYDMEIGRVMENCAALSERVWNLRRLHDDDAIRSHIEAAVMQTARLIAEK
ncbi:MAG: hypothetical protein E7644_08245 [Ruminococcaceae bacterium]|nr:hypothetical protein [Oscillospiraceae bacterium]